MAKHLRTGAVTVQCELRTVSSVIDEYDLERVDLLKVDCEGAELDVLLGITNEHWPRISKVIAEVHDTDDRLCQVTELLKSKGLTNLTIAKEAGFEDTAMHNIYATRELENQEHS